MKGGQLPDLPPEVKAARDTLAAWLNKQKLFRSRDLRAFDEAQEAIDDAEGRGGVMVQDRTLDTCPAIVTVHDCQDIDEGEDAKRAAVSRLFERERAILGTVRPDLDDDDRAWLAKSLVQEWTGEKVRSAQPNRKRSRRRRWPSADRDLPPRMTSPSQLARTIAQLARDVERDPASYENEKHWEDLLACLHYVQEAIGSIANYKNAPW